MRLVRIDVVVVAYRSRADLRKCVEPLAGADDIDVIVVDNACPEDSVETVAHLPVHVVRTGRNAGFGAGCNAGASAGTGDAILFLNPDARVSVRSVRRLARALAEDERLGAVGPLIREVDGSIQYSMRRAPRLGTAFGEALFLHHALPKAPWLTEVVRDGYDERREAEWLIGAVLCVRREAFERVGGFDTRLLHYVEDTDLCVRLRHAGYRLAFEPAAAARHEGGASVPRPMLVPVKAQARLVYARLHERGLRYAGFRVAFALYELLRLPVALSRSRDHAKARLEAFLLILDGRRRAALPGAD